MNLDPLVHLIYEGLLEKDPWSSFLHAYRLHLQSSSAMLMVGLPSASSEAHDIDDSEWQVKALKKIYYSKYIAINPIRHRDMEYGKVYSMLDFLEPEGLKSSTYFNEYLQYAGLAYALIAYVGDVNGTEYWLHVSRGEQYGDYSPYDRDLTAQLVPHINRALRLKAAMTGAEEEKIAYKDALNTAKVSIVLLNKSGVILNMNERAASILSRHSAFTAADRQLCLTDAAEQKHFSALLERVTTDSTQPDFAVMTAGERSNNAVNMLLRNYGANTDALAANQTVAAVLYLKGPAEPPSVSADAIAILYGLRPTEARLAATLAGGASIKEASVKLGMSELTVRTYVKRILNKTGTRRQSDLIQLINSGLAMMA